MSGARRPLIAGNWKMNGLASEAEALARALRDAGDTGGDLLVCPPATVLCRVAALLVGSAVRVGGQDCAVDPHGAHTGDVAAEMLADAGATSVIVGHSERRHDHGETDALVRTKAEAAMRAGLMPIVCVGETSAERDAGRETAVVCGQIAASLPDGFAGVVAYEPVWAIGTGRTPHANDVIAVHAHAREALIARLGDAGRLVPILYGGSVKPANAGELLRLPEVGGALVGGVSLAAADFLAVARAAAG